MDLLKQRTAAPVDGPCRYLISLDYDGTLRQNFGPAIAPEFVELMTQLRPLGFRWGINTGRRIDKLLEDIAPCLDYLPDFICTRERDVYLADKQGYLQEDAFNNQQAQAHHEELMSRYAHIVQQGFEKMHSLYPQVTWAPCEVEALSVISEDEAGMDILYPYLCQLGSTLKGVNIQRAGRFMRYCDERYHKGTALARVAQAWAIPPSCLMIMGDGHNDLCAFEAFEQAFHACPHIAHPDIIAYIQAHQGYHSPAGVIEAIEYWLKSLSFANHLA